MFTSDHMTNRRLLFFGLCASFAVSCAAHAQGLLGHRYLEINAGYERFTGDSIDGQGAGGALNLPLRQEPGEFGWDLHAEIDYLRAKDSGVTLSATQIGASVRGFMPLDGGLKPFAGAGLNHVRLKAYGFGESESDSALYLPLDFGLEFATGSFSLTPFFRYSLALESDWDDSWAVGLGTAYWFDIGWGTTLTASHTDFDGGTEVLGVRLGLVFPF